jgi:Transposase DDE domain group 1
MSVQSAWQGSFSFLDNLPIVVEPSAALLTSDAGLLPFRELDQRLHLTEQFAQALDDPRDLELVSHTFLEMTRARVYGILADYEDQNDHDALRADPIFKLMAGRAPDGPDLASQPTHSRFENAISVRSLFRLRDVFIDQFIASFATAPQHLTFDIDAVDDPAHGEQQLVLFHGYFEQYQYFPSFITCADNDQVVVLSLRPGAVHAALGADDDVEYLVNRLRQAWPDVHVHVRGDAGNGVPWMYAVCERLRIDYTFGLSSNAVLKRHSESLLERAVAALAATGQAQRLFEAFWYQAGTWELPRWVIVKAEANALGTNRRFIVTNRSGAQVLPEATYDDYAARGEGENRNKELKCGLLIDRTSDHRFLANFFPAVSAWSGLQPVGSSASGRGVTAIAAPSRTACGSPGGTSTPQPLFPPPSAGSLGRRTALHLAKPVDQGGSGDRGEHAPDRGALVRNLAVLGLVSACLSVSPGSSNRTDRLKAKSTSHTGGKGVVCAEDPRSPRASSQPLQFNTS